MVWPQCCSTSSISTGQSTSRVKAPAFSHNCPGQKTPSNSGQGFSFTSSAPWRAYIGSTGLPAWLFMLLTLLVSYRLLRVQRKSKEKILEKESRSWECSRWDQRMFFILQSVCAFKYKGILCLLVLFVYNTLRGKKRFWFVCFSVTVGCANSAGI